jgi:hypothetical protein
MILRKTQRLPLSAERLPKTPYELNVEVVNGPAHPAFITLSISNCLQNPRPFTVQAEHRKAATNIYSHVCRPPHCLTSTSGSVAMLMSLST